MKRKRRKSRLRCVESVSTSPGPIFWCHFPLLGLRTSVAGRRIFLVEFIFTLFGCRLSISICLSLCRTASYTTLTFASLEIMKMMIYICLQYCVMPPPTLSRKNAHLAALPPRICLANLLNLELSIWILRICSSLSRSLPLCIDSGAI